MRWIEKHLYSPLVPWQLLGWLFLSVIAVIIYYITQFAITTQPTGPANSTYTLAVVAMLYAFGLTLLCIKGMPLKEAKESFLPLTSTGSYISPILIGLSIAIFGLGEIGWIVHMHVTGHLHPYPEPQDFMLFGMYPCLMGAILLLPARNLSHLARARIFLDSLLIMVAVATLCYYFILAPLLVHGDGSFEAKLVSTLYISADLVLMFCLVLVVLRSNERLLRPVLILLGCAIFSMFLTHLVHTYEMLYQGYNDFSKANIGWPITGIFLVGAAQTISNILKRGELKEQMSHLQPEKKEVIFSDRRWKAALPALLVLVFGLLVLATWLSGGSESFSGQKSIVYGGGFVVLILMVLRQLLTLYQVGALQRQLQLKNSSLSLLNTRLEDQAARDALTGLPNHRTVVEKLDEALKKARATNGNCAVIFMDIDKFKSINDTYGHLTGDTVLSNFGTLVKSGLRPGDWVGRWGGEEFVAILPQTEPLEAMNLAEGLRKRIDRHVLAGNGEIKVTCSLGIACYPEDASEREDLITRADQAMYAAKQFGRNQTRTAHEPLVRAMSLALPECENSADGDELAVVDAMLALLEARDLSTGQHVRRVAALSLKLALALGLNSHEAQIVNLGGLLHDMGKLAIPDAVLGKRGRLNEAELTAMHQHPITGAAILQPIHALRSVAPIVHAHHEQIDGSGYPDGLRGEEIPLGARIVAVADFYDALTNERAYHSACPSHEVLQKLQQGAGSQFDPRVVEALTQLLAANTNLSDVA